MKQVAIMQPYFFPYIGYYQLIKSVDDFIVYDNIKYTKSSFINKNYILLNKEKKLFSIPLKKDSNSLNIKDRYISPVWEKERQKLLNQIKQSYSRSIYFEEGFSIIEKCIMFNSSNLFSFIYNSLKQICEYLSINTNLLISSQVPHDSSLKSSGRVIDLCKSLRAVSYVNPPGGKELYCKKIFKNSGIDLKFLEPEINPYNQGVGNFISHLSIIDLIVFQGKDQLKEQLNKYSYS